MSVIGEILVTIRGDDSKLKSDLDSAEGKVDNFASGISGRLNDVFRGAFERIGQLGTEALLGAGQAAVSYLGDSIGAASDLSENINKVNVVFGESAEEILAWSNTAASALGQSKQGALEAAGTFGNLFASMGLGKDATKDMSIGLVELASDLASFNNVSPEEALEALRSGILGESEPLKAFGVNLSAAKIEAKALELGLVESTVAIEDVNRATLNIEIAQKAAQAALKASGANSLEYRNAVLKVTEAESRLETVMAGSNAELTDAAKAQAAYAIIMDETALAQGDFANTSDGLANSQRIIAANFKDIKATIGAGLLPVVGVLSTLFKDLLVAVMPGLSDVMNNKVTPAITNLAAGLSNLIENSSITFDSDYKGIKLGDVFEFMHDNTSGGLVELNIADYVKFLYDPDNGANNVNFTIGDFFSFIKDDEVVTLNIADYINFVYDPTSGITQLSLGDVFSFNQDQGEGITEINIADYVTFKYDLANGKDNINFTIGDFFSFIKDDEVITFNLADYVKFLYDPTSNEFSLKIGDIIDLDQADLDKATGAIQAAVDTLTNAFETLKTNALALKDTLSNLSLADVITAITEAIDGLTIDAGVLRDKLLQSVTDSITGVNWQDLSLDFAGLIDSISQSIAAIDFSKIKIEDIGLALLGVVGSTIKGIVWVMDSENWAGLVTAVSDSLGAIEWEAISGAFVSLGETIKAALGEIDVSALTDLFADSDVASRIDGIRNNFDVLGTTLTTIKDGILSANDAINGYISAVEANVAALPGFETISAALKDLVGIKESLDGAGESFITFEGYFTRVAESLTTFEESVNGFGDRLSEQWTAAGEILSTYFSAVNEQITAAQAVFDTFGTTISNLFSEGGTGLSEASASISEAFSSASISIAAVGSAFTAILDRIKANLWPSFPEDVTTLVDSIIAFNWPGFDEALTAIITKITTWVWPGFGAALQGAIDAILAFEWPDFGGDLKALINAIINFEWPTLAAPAWLNSLLSFNGGGAPAAANSAATLPQSTTSGVNPNSPLGQASQGAANRFPTTNANKSVQIGTVNVNNNVDAQELLYQMSQRLAYG